ncbi:hypothetical protein [Alkalihalobacillus sp. TS-13]|uniref:hypothetical protein n=1 Tax=Alkalihalobacillus sp. TS-13 TaxID=2842455 RepID=UPI001C88D7D0|nr:hypothetical protein [Alkalihalobacillus sp. TS-13]
MLDRQALLVGSLPFNNEKEAMGIALEVLNNTLLSLPDGEVGNRSDQYPNGNRSSWAVTAIDSCIADTEHWNVVKKGTLGENGFPVDYDSFYKIRPKCSPEEIVHYLNFRYHDYFRKSYHIFQRLREQHGLKDLKFQVGIPTGLAISLFMLESDNVFLYYEAFNQRLAYEVNEFLNEAGEDVIIQIEIPAELGLVYDSPSQYDFALTSIIDLVKRIQEPVKVGIHECYGDLNHKAFTHPQSLDRMVDFTNKLIDVWPKTHELTYIHFPLAIGHLPPTLNRHYYEPLKQIQLPDHTRFVAGIVHEECDLPELHQILNIIETIRNHKVDVACSCGMGRRSPDVSMRLMKFMKQLVEA